MSVFKARLHEIINTNFNQKSSSKSNFTESPQITSFNKSKIGIPNDFLGKSAKLVQSKQKKRKFDLSKSLTELGLKQPTNSRHSHGFFNYEDPTLKTQTTTTSSYLENTLKRNQMESSSSYSNFSFSIAKSQLKNMHHNAQTPINNSFTFTRSNSKPHSRIQKQIEDISKTLNDKPQPKGGNLHRPIFTEVNLDQKEYLSISPLNLRKGILSKATHSVVSQIGNIKGRNSNLNNNNGHHAQQNSIFDFLLSKGKQGKIPLMNRKYISEKQNSEAEDFYGSLLSNPNKTKQCHPNQNQSSPIKGLTTESNYLNTNIAHINKRSLSQKIVFNF